MFNIIEKNLTDGNSRFYTDKPISQNNNLKRLKETSLKQSPVVTVLGCSDSRVSPEIVFDQSIGDIFSIRVVGNVINESVIGSIEYGIDHLKTPLLVILGHKDCGACISAIEEKDIPENSKHIIDQIINIKNKILLEEPGLSHKDLLNKVVIENVKNSISKLLEVSEITNNLVHNSSLKVIGAVYDISTGKIDWI